MASSRKPAPQNNPVPAAAPGDPILAALHDALSEWLAQRPSAARPAGPGAAPVAIPDSHNDALLIAVAFSGGLDSSVLLDAAVRIAPALGVRVVAFHVHHGLSPDADAWADFCAARAAVLGAAFDERRVTVLQGEGTGIEAAARTARYAALHDMCREHGASCLLLAHHADDQAETVLLQLLRGSGLPGVAGMAAEVPDALTGVPLLRPWLGVTRASLGAYAQTHALAWIEDSSNQDVRYLRNALRHDVLPAVARHVPGYRDTLARFARHAQQAQGLLDELAAQDLQKLYAPPDNVLSQRALCQLSDARIGNVLRYWLRQQGMRTISEARLADWVRQIRSAGRDARLTLAHEGGTLRLYRERLEWGVSASKADAARASIASRLHWSGERCWPLPGWHGHLVFAPCTGDAGTTTVAVPESCLRTGELAALPRSGGERLRLHPHQPRKTLKNLFQAAGVPAWQRNVPVIWLGAHILFVPYLGVDCDWSAAPWSTDGDEPRWCLAWQDDAAAFPAAAPAKKSMR